MKLRTWFIATLVFVSILGNSYHYFQAKRSRESLRRLRLETKKQIPRDVFQYVISSFEERTGKRVEVVIDGESFFLSRWQDSDAVYLQPVKLPADWNARIKFYEVGK